MYSRARALEKVRVFVFILLALFSWLQFILNILIIVIQSKKHIFLATNIIFKVAPLFILELPVVNDEWFQYIGRALDRETGKLVCPEKQEFPLLKDNIKLL